MLLPFRQIRPQRDRLQLINHFEWTLPEKTGISRIKVFQFSKIWYNTTRLKQKSDGSSYNKIIAKNIVVKGCSVEFTLINGASKIPGGRVGKKYVVTEGVWIYPDQ